MNKIIDKPMFEVFILTKQSFYKEDLGEGVAAPLRVGRLNQTEEMSDDLIYKNRKVINTMFGTKPFIPRVEMRAFIEGYGKAYLVIDVFNHEAAQFLKKYTVRTQPNNLTITDLSDLWKSIKEILEADTDTTLIELVETLTTAENFTCEIVG